MSARSATSHAGGLAAPSQLVDPDGSVRLEALSPDAQVALYARLVHRGQHGLVEVVRATRRADGQLRMRSRRDPRGYLEAGDAHALCRLAGMARGRGEEVFATPLPRQGSGSTPFMGIWDDPAGEDAAFGRRARSSSPRAPSSCLRWRREQKRRCSPKVIP